MQAADPSTYVAADSSHRGPRNVLEDFGEKMAQPG